MSIVVFTDGGCAGNPGPGGWAYVLDAEGKRVTGSGGEPDTTNNRMELTAVTRALELVASTLAWRSQTVEIHTDSQYVQRGMTEWIIRWAAKGWKTAGKEPVKNQDLWKGLSALASALTVSWHWVKGHDGNELNELCDSMVQEAIAAVKGGRR